MAFDFTITNVHNIGALRRVHGTWTSADGDNEMSLTPSTHGLNYLTDHKIEVDAVGAQVPQVTKSGGTLTADFTDTLGQSGRFVLDGR